VSAQPRELYFSRSLYRPESVEAAAQAFEAVAQLDIVREGDAVRVTVAAVHPRLADRADQIILEFCNRALYETIRAERAGSLL